MDLCFRRSDTGSRHADAETCGTEYTVSCVLSQRTCKRETVPFYQPRVNVQYSGVWGSGQHGCSGGLSRYLPPAAHVPYPVPSDGLQDIRDRVSFTDNQKIDFLQKAGKAGIEQCFVLSTCNRSEVYFFAPEEIAQPLGVIRTHLLPLFFCCFKRNFQKFLICHSI